MGKITKTIKKLSGYKGPTLKTLIPKTKPLISKPSSITQILGIRKRKTELNKIIISSQRILFKRSKKRFKIPKRIKSKIKKIGDAKKPIPYQPTSQIIQSSIAQQPGHQITSVEQVIWIRLSDKGKRELKSAFDFGHRFHKSRIRDIANEMNDIYSSLRAFAAQMISKHVPRDTGDLQSSLLSSLSGIGTKKPPMFPRSENQLELRMGYYSNIYYLPYVNNPKRIITVRHHRNMGIISYRGGRHYLHDPTAKTKFMLTSKAAIRKEAKRLTKNMIRRLYLKWGLRGASGSGFVKGMFKYTGMGRF